jgi:2-methylisocitrate lyase-like PEP mutase family enzyme
MGRVAFLCNTNTQKPCTMSVAKKEFKKVTTHSLQQMKDQGEKISMLTAYDFTMAKMVDAAGVDCILVGDSASNVMAGHETTLPITLDQMIYHASSVVRAVDRALVVVDLPFGAYPRKFKRGPYFSGSCDEGKWRTCSEA